MDELTPTQAAYAGLFADNSKEVMDYENLAREAIALRDAMPHSMAQVRDFLTRVAEALKAAI